MKNLLPSKIIFVAAISFFVLFGANKMISAQANQAVKAKIVANSPKPATKRPDEKKLGGAKSPDKAKLSIAKETLQIIVSVTSARVRREPDLAAETVKTAKVGVIFSVLEQNQDWYKVSVESDKPTSTGWISKTIVQQFAEAKRGEIYQGIAGKYVKQPAIDFATAAQVFDFLTGAQKEIKNAAQRADLSFKRLLILSAALKNVEFGKAEEKPFKDFLAANEAEAVYSEPSGQWLVRSEKFWALREKFEILPIAEEIAWTAAQNPIPGECEGYINCYLYSLRTTEGEYLNFYPNGKHSREALKNLTNFLEPIVADSREKSVYSSASDTSDRAEFNKLLTELRAIVSKTPHAEKSKTLQQIKSIAEAHR